KDTQEEAGREEEAGLQKDIQQEAGGEEKAGPQEGGEQKATAQKRFAVRADSRHSAVYGAPRRRLHEREAARAF
ncbi:MAG: hypothetical protein ACE5FV_14455, partial [Woeseia sp.]